MFWCYLTRAPSFTCLLCPHSSLQIFKKDFEYHSFYSDFLFATFIQARFME